MRVISWNTVYAIGLCVYVLTRGIFERRAKGSEKIFRRLDTLEKCLLVLVGIGSILLPLTYLFTPLLSFADYQLPKIVPWCGSMVMVCALWLFYRSHVDLGENWSVTLELRKGHKLIRHGVYRRIRHPMYAAILLWSLAQGLLLQNWLAGWSAITTFAVMYIVRTPREEDMMNGLFGEEYRNYMRQTGRLFPRFNVDGKRL